MDTTKPEKNTQDKAAKVKAKNEAKAARVDTSRQKADAEQGESLGGRIARLREFFEQSKVEMKKVTWPTRKETIQTSIAVIVLSLVMGLYLWIVDIGLSKIVSAILS